MTNRTFLLILIFTHFFLSCNETSKEKDASSKDSTGQILPYAPTQLPTVSEFKDKLKASYPHLDSVFFQFHVDTFLIERRVDSLLDPGLVHNTTFSYSAALEKYLEVWKAMQKTLYQHLPKEAHSTFTEEERAWFQYYLRVQDVVSKVDDDKNLGLGADYVRLIPQDLLQLVKQRVEVLFTWYWRVVEKDQR